MMTYRSSVHRISRRALFGALLLWFVSASAAPAMAQTTIKIVPDPAVFPVNNTATVTIVAENVPADGLKGFNAVLRWSSETIFWNNQVPVLDPNLATSWGGIGNVNQFAFLSPTQDSLTWQATSDGSRIGPSGTVVLGTITFVGGATITSGQFDWDATSGLATQGPQLFDPFQVLQSSQYQVGAAQSDLTIDCTRTSPADPNFVVDGDTVSVDCTVTNNGPQTTGKSTDARAVVSADSIVNASDTFIADTFVNVLANGATQNLTLTGAPVFAIGGTFNICVKVDVGDPSQPNGSILETNESNNTWCEQIQVAAPERDLSITSLDATPNPVDPNAFHAGTLIEITYSIKNNGNAKVRQHTNVVRLSTDDVITSGDTLLCSYEEPSNPGILGGQTVTRTFGTDNVQGTFNLCKLALTLTPGTYYIGLEVDANFDVVETDETNNTASMQVVIEAPLPSPVGAHDRNSSNNPNVVIFGPGKWPMGVSIYNVVDLVGYGFTMTWSDPNLMFIADPNDVGYVNPDDPNMTIPILEQNGRIQTCAPPVINNAAGTLTVSCTSSGSQAGASIEGAGLLAWVTFTPIKIGEGSLTLSGVTLTPTSGTLQAAPQDANYVVTGDPVLAIDSAATPGEAFPGTLFEVSYRICNNGFGATTPNVPMTVVMSADDFIADPPAAPDQIICRFTETTRILPNECRPRTITNCLISVDSPPGIYNTSFRLNPSLEVRESLRLPPRIIATRQAGKSKKSVETTRTPDQIGGSVGAVLANDKKFPGQSVAILNARSRELNFMAALVKPTDKPKEVQLFRIPKYPGEDLEALTRLRLPKEIRAVVGSADVNGDGDDELILIGSRGGHDYLDFRSVDYTKRKPVVGLSAAITDLLPDKVIGATGVEWDNVDLEREIALVTVGASGPVLTIYDLAVTTPPAPPLPPTFSTLTEVASDTATLGAGGETVEAVCSADYELNGTDRIVVLTRDPGGQQAVKVFGLPTGIGSDDAAPIADDAAFGGTQGLKKALALTCSHGNSTGQAN